MIIFCTYICKNIIFEFLPQLMGGISFLFNTLTSVDQLLQKNLVTCFCSLLYITLKFNEKDGVELFIRNDHNFDQNNQAARSQWLSGEGFCEIVYTSDRDILSSQVNLHIINQKRKEGRCGHVFFFFNFAIFSL